ncbi:DUF2156 domain-containing protein [bacterium CPR1]|nr:DUF2156 domain-containing protein [bacterium CPR1]
MTLSERIDAFGPPTPAFALPSSGWRTFQDCLAYVDYAGCWLAIGQPLGPDPQAMASEFARQARERGRRAAFFGWSPSGWQALPVGQEAWFEAGQWRPERVGEFLRRARRKGVSVREDPPEADLEPLVRAWRHRQGMPPMGFLAAGRPLEMGPARRRWAAYSSAGACLGLLVAVDLGGGNHLVDFLILGRPVPQGTAELLLDTAMKSLPGRVSLGFTALAGLPARGGPLLALMRAASNHLNWLYGFKGIYNFRARLGCRFRPIVLAAEPGQLTRALWASLVAFSHGRPDRFALVTAGRLLSQPARVREPEGWALGAELLAAALIPWTAVLALCDSERWFGVAWLARAWASFDVLILTLFWLLGQGLRRRRRQARTLGFLLLGAVLADCWMTFAQALLYNIPRASSGWDWLGLLIGCSGPPLAALFLSALLLRAPLRR